MVEDGEELFTGAFEDGENVIVGLAVGVAATTGGGGGGGTA